MFGNGDRMSLGWKHMQTIWKHQLNKFKKQLHYQSSCCTERSVIWTPGLFNSGVRFWQQHITTIGVDRWLCWPFIILHLWNILEFLESMTNQNWLVVDLPLWKILVNWDDYSQYMESHKIHVPDHQPVYTYYTLYNHIYNQTTNQRITWNHRVFNPVTIASSLAWDAQITSAGWGLPVAGAA